MLRMLTFSLALLATAAQSAGASTHCVNPGGTGGCFSTIGAALAAAANGDEIEIEAGTYSFGFVLVDKRLTLRGVGAGSTVLEGSIRPAVRIATKTKVTLQDMTIRSTDPVGGAAMDLATKSKVTVEDAVFDRGGISLDYAARLKAERTTIDGLAGGFGGLSVGANARVDLTASTISREFTAAFVAGRLTLRDSTVANNGTGILTNSERARVKLFSSTIARNFGVGLDLNGGRVWMANTVLANNSGGSGPDCDVLGTTKIVSKGFNLVGDAAPCTMVGNTDDDVTGVAPLLSALGSHGGPTETIELLAGSPAIDAGNPRPPRRQAGGRCGPLDQRGVPRVDRCDIGAFEVGGP